MRQYSWVELMCYRSPASEALTLIISLMATLTQKWNPRPVLILCLSRTLTRTSTSATAQGEQLNAAVSELGEQLITAHQEALYSPGHGMQSHQAVPLAANLATAAMCAIAAIRTITAHATATL